MNDKERLRAGDTVNSAVQDYAKDPSRANAAAVDVAWQTFQKLNAISFWQQWKGERLDPVNSRPRTTGGSK